jgi:DNA-binding response OmpR family regulator/predicted DNA-binding transcriptional regulator AlpA
VAEAGAEAKDAPEGAPADKPLLLVIDDNADIRALVNQLLSDEYEIHEAENGKEGLAKAARFVPDLIICDIMMPVMDGLECCRRIKAEISTSHIPVLMLTACSMDEQRVEGYDSGADGYVSKPFNGEVLRARCRNLIANRRRINDLWQSQSKLQQPAAPVAPARTESAPAPAAANAVVAETKDLDNEFYARFLQLFFAEISNPDLNIEQIASKMGLGHSQFYRKIKSLTNYTPVELMRQLRLKQARQLLTTTSKSISEIAYEVGFSSPAYFTKCYRQAFGETPSDLRDNLGQ